MDRMTKIQQLLADDSLKPPWNKLHELPEVYWWKHAGEPYDISDDTPMTYELLIKKLKDLEYRVQNIEGGVTPIPQSYLFATMSGNQTIDSGGPITVHFDNLVADTTGLYSEDDYGFFATGEGTFEIEASVRVSCPEDLQVPSYIEAYNATNLTTVAYGPTIGSVVDREAQFYVRISSKSLITDTLNVIRYMAVHNSCTILAAGSWFTAKKY
jgi:hypothetical protein